MSQVLLLVLVLVTWLILSIWLGLRVGRFLRDVTYPDAHEVSHDDVCEPNQPRQMAGATVHAGRVLSPRGGSRQLRGSTPATDSLDE